MRFVQNAAEPLRQLAAPFIPRKTSSEKMKDCEECLQTASRVTLSFVQFLAIYKSWIVGYGLAKWVGSASLAYPTFIIVGGLDRRSSCYALATLMGRAALYCLKNGDRFKSAQIAFLAMTALTFLHVAHEKPSEGSLTQFLDQSCVVLIFRFSKFFSKA